MRKTENNYAFIDSQNLNLGIRDLGWRLDYKRFRIYLYEVFSVQKAYLFIGFVPSNKKLYRKLKEAGFRLIFKQITIDNEGNMKGNVDADLVLKAIIEYKNFDKAIVVTNDGDFYSLVDYFYSMNKLEIVLSPDIRKCSRLLRQTAKEKIISLNNLKERLEYK